MNNARYQQIRIFQTIASEGSITAAARKLEITAPSVSKALKTLEQHIGLPLFSRSTRRIELTEAGRRLLARSSDAVQALQAAVESVRDENRAPAGLVRVTLSRFAYQLIFRPHLAEISARYPQLQLELSLYDGTINILEHGYDLGIRFGDTLEDGVVARQLLPPLAEDLYASLEYLARHGTPQTPADLAAHRLIGYRYITANRILPLTLDADGEPLTVDMPAPLISNDIDIMADAIRAGLGIGRLFAPICARLPDRERFQPVLRLLAHLPRRVPLPSATRTKNPPRTGTHRFSVRKSGGDGDRMISDEISIYYQNTYIFSNEKTPQRHIFSKELLMKSTFFLTNLS